MQIATSSRLVIAEFIIFSATFNHFNAKFIILNAKSHLFIASSWVDLRDCKDFIIIIHQI